MLQGELWTTRLATEVGIEQDTGVALWVAFVEQVLQRLHEEQTLDFADLGQWCSIISSEYVAETDGGAYLIPPRVRLDIRLGEEHATPLQELALSLEHRTGVCRDTISQWLEAIPRLAMTLMSAGYVVVWDGLGVWERTIKGDCFTPSEDFSEALNRPFASFRVELLHTGDRIGLECRNISLEEVMLIPSLYLSRQVPGALSLIEEEDESILEANNVISPTPQQSLDVAPVCTEPVVESISNIEQEKREERKSYWGYYLLFVLLMSGLALFLYYRLGGFFEVRETQHGDSSNLTLPPQELVGKADSLSEVTSDSLVEDTLLRGKSETVENPQPQIKEQEQENPTKTKGRAEQISPKRIDTSAEQKPIQKKQTKQEQTPKATNPTAEQREEVSLKADESLAVLAQRKYGHRAFWVYIYEENREHIANPHNIPIGTRLVLPPASKYGIDKNNTKSLNQALLLGRSL